MNEKLVITSLFNCGILIKSADLTVLVDGINRDTEFFDGMPQDLYLKLMNREEPFGDIDYLLFTHDHKDHLDGERLAGYVSKNKVKGIFLPLSDASRDFSLQEILSRKVPRPTAIHPPFGAKRRWEFEAGAGGLTYFAAAHLTPIDRAVNHHALLLELQGKRIYFSGDADFRTREQQENLYGSDIDVAFFNPFHLNMPAGREIIKSVNARHNFIYHLPPEGKDRFSVRRQAVRDREKHEKDLPGTKLILDAMETCYLLV